MKKNGFTLAEVLITLTIIGVVAVLTLPALLTNTQEQQAKTALRKMTSTMTNLAAMSVAIDGFDYTGITKESKPAEIKPTEESASLLNMFAARATINRSSDVINDKSKLNLTSKENFIRAVFNDGTVVYFDKSAPSAASGITQKDGLHRGFVVVFDTNGDKGPNIISNCQGTTTGLVALDGDDATTKTCETKANRVLRDQYVMVLRGTKVDPIGAASTYVMTDSVKKIGKANTVAGDPEGDGDGE